MAQVLAVLTQLGLQDLADRPVKTYSGGCGAGSTWARAWWARPRLLLLDEPTTGFDPRSRNQLWEAIRDLVGRRADVLLTTQWPRAALGMRKPFCNLMVQRFLIRNSWRGRLEPPG